MTPSGANNAGALLGAVLCKASNLATDHQAVGNGQQDTFDPRVRAELFIQVIYGARGLVFGIYHLTTLEHVVEYDQAIRSQSSKNELIVELIGRFIGIDEGEVEHWGLRASPRAPDARLPSAARSGCLRQRASNNGAPRLPSRH